MNSALIGRERECHALQDLLRRDDVGLVCVTGPGGIGKTRLALEVAQRALSIFEHGITVVLLAAVREPEFMITSVAQALGLTGQDDVMPLQRVAGFLQDKRLLLVLDNFEQLMQAAPVVSELLARAPGLKVLVTSRTRLHVSGEHEYPLGALALPTAAAAARAGETQRAPAVALFVQRAQAVQPSFALRGDNVDAVAAICLRLDGWPLAIELAAARMKVMTPAQMLQRLGRRLPLLKGGPVDGPLRQRTMSDTLDWSHELLGEEERRLFAELSVFRGGAALEAIEGVCSGGPALLGSLQALVDHSLVAQSAGRFVMLETVAEYAGDRLAQRADADEIHLRHARHYTAVAEQAEPELAGARQRWWFAQMRADLDNVRAALGWSLAAGHAELALRHAVALGLFWMVGGLALEGRRWLEAALKASGDAHDVLRAQAIMRLCDAASRLGDAAQGRHLAEDACRRFRALGHRPGLAKASIELGWALSWGSGDAEAARRAFEEGLAIFEELGDVVGQSNGADALGSWYRDNGQLATARDLLERGLALAIQAENPAYMAVSLMNLGGVCGLQGHYDDASRHTQQALALSYELGDRTCAAICRCNLADIAHLRGDLAGACEMFKQGLAEASEVGDVRALAGFAIDDFAQVCLEAGLARAAMQLTAAATAMRERHQVALGAGASAAVRARVENLRRVLGPHAVDLALDAARAMSLNDIMALARSIEIQPPSTTAPPSARDRSLPSLTPREQEILRLVAQGLTDRQIGERLNISAATASKHVANLLAKTMQRNRLALAIWAKDRGLAGPAAAEH